MISSVQKETYRFLEPNVCARVQDKETEIYNFQTLSWEKVITPGLAERIRDKGSDCSKEDMDFKIHYFSQSILQSKL